MCVLVPNFMVQVLTTSGYSLKLIYFQLTPTIPRFYRARSTSHNGNTNSFCWGPGVTIPVSAPVMSTPLHRCSNSQAPLPPVRLNAEFSSESESETAESDDLSVQSTLKAILLSQKNLQKQMKQILSRVNDLEESIKVTTASCSSSDEKKRKKRLSSDLCVSTFFHVRSVSRHAYL